MYRLQTKFCLRIFFGFCWYQLTTAIIIDVARAFLLFSVNRLCIQSEKTIKRIEKRFSLLLLLLL